MKKNCVAIKKINGNISNIIDGELNNERYIGYQKLTSMLFKNSISCKILRIKTKLNITKSTLINDTKNFDIKNFIYVFII